MVDAGTIVISFAKHRPGAEDCLLYRFHVDVGVVMMFDLEELPCHDISYQSRNLVSFGKIGGSRVVSDEQNCMLAVEAKPAQAPPQSSHLCIFRVWQINFASTSSGSTRPSVQKILIGRSPIDQVRSC